MVVTEAPQLKAPDFSLDFSKWAGPDDSHLQTVRWVADFLAEPLSNSFSNSIPTAVAPFDWRLPILCPINTRVTQRTFPTTLVPISICHPNPCFVYVVSSGPLWPTFNHYKSQSNRWKLQHLTALSLHSTLGTYSSLFTACPILNCNQLSIWCYAIQTVFVCCVGNRFD